MRSLFLFIIFIQLFSANHSFAQTYTWNDFRSGNYIVDYEAEHRKLINPNAGYNVFDFEVDTITQKLMILTNDGIVVRELDGSFDRFIAIDKTGDERKLKLDPIRKQIYVIVGVSIYRLNYDGTNIIELYREDAEYIEDLAIDLYRNKMYWRQGYSLERIRSASLDGSNVKTVYQGAEIRDLQFDVSRNQLYFRNIDDWLIEKLDFNSNAISTVYSYPIVTDYVSGIFLDEQHHLLYFQTSTPHQNFRLDLTSNVVEDVFDFEHRITTLKPFQDHLFVYVESYQQRRIVDFDLTTNELKVIVKREEYLDNFVIDETNERWIGTTPFGSIQSTDMFGNLIKEHRPLGMNSIIDIQIVDDKMVFLDGRNLYSTNFQFEELELLTTLEELSPAKITHNPNDNKIYIVTRWAGNIYRCNLDGSQYEKFIQLDSLDYRSYPFTDIVFSDYNDKFYLTARDDSLLIQMDEDGTNLVTLESGDFNDDLTNLALDATGRYLYYRSAKLGEIYQLDVATKERITYASNVPNAIGALFVHPTEGALYAVNSSDELIYKFENGSAVVAFQDDLNVNLGNTLAIDQAGNFYTGLFLDYQAIRRFSPSLTAASSHLHRNYRYGQQLEYYQEENELWGIVKPNITSPFSRPFKMNLDNDEMIYYPEIGNNSELLIVPEHNMIYWVEQSEDRSIIRNNLSTGTIDTILYIDQNFRRYSSLIYNPVNQRIYYSSTDANLRLRSTDAFGNDMQIENYNEDIITMVAVNEVDSTITFLDNLGDDRIHRWNFQTGSFVTYGEQQEGFYKRSWNLTDTYYDDIDEDGDGFSFIEDCDDAVASINPDALEIPDNDIDENCDGIYGFTDEDGDGVPVNFDCDDQDSLINIYAIEIPNNDVDENCDEIILIIDEDGDGFNSDEDCDDLNADINPDAIEIPNNYIDEDCDEILGGTDEDNDGFFITDDCDDTNPDVNPNAFEIVYNGIDDDCNMLTPDDDLDGDGYVLAEDCDDTNPDINPDAVEIPYNGIDEDCDPLTYDDDLDQDGFIMAEDCDDDNPAINTDQLEVPYNTLDDDCDPLTPDDDLDGDGFLLADDCDDENPDVNPDQEEIVGNGIDDDCDDLIDEISGVHQLGNVEIRIFPNPTNQYVYIQTDEFLNLNIKLHDNIGQLIFSGANRNQIDVSDVTPGAYLLTLEDQSSGNRIVDKIIVVD